MGSVKEKDVLEDVKRADKIVRAHLLIKQLGKLKVLAREILIAKQKSNLILQDLGIEDKDIKRIIDFVNSCNDVCLTENDLAEIQKEVKEKGRRTRQEVQEKIESSPAFFTTATATGVGGSIGSFSGYSINTAQGGSTTAYASAEGANTTIVGGDGSTLEVNL